MLTDSLPGIISTTVYRSDVLAVVIEPEYDVLNNICPLSAAITDMSAAAAIGTKAVCNGATRHRATNREIIRFLYFFLALNIDSASLFFIIFYSLKALRFRFIVCHITTPPFPIFTHVKKAFAQAYAYYLIRQGPESMPLRIFVVKCGNAAGMLGCLSRFCRATWRQKDRRHV